MAERIKFWRSRSERPDDEVQPESPKKRQRRTFADPPVATAGSTFKSLLHKVNLWARQSASVLGFTDAKALEPGPSVAQEYSPWSIPSSRQSEQVDASEESSSALRATVSCQQQPVSKSTDKPALSVATPAPAAPATPPGAPRHNVQHSCRASTTTALLRLDSDASEAAEEASALPGTASGPDLHITVSFRQKSTAGKLGGSTPARSAFAAKSRILDTFDFARMEADSQSSGSWTQEESLPSVRETDEQAGSRIDQFIRALAHGDRSNSSSTEHECPGIAPHPDPSLPACQPLECRASSDSVEPLEDCTPAGPPARKRKVKFCDEEDPSLDSPVTGMAYPPEWAIAHNRALCSAKHFSILRRVPRRGLLSNVWSPKNPLRFQSLAPLLPLTPSKQPQAARPEGGSLLDDKQQLLGPEPCSMTDEELDAVNLSPLAQGVDAISTPEAPRKLEFEAQQQQGSGWQSLRQRYRKAYFGLKLWRAHVEGQPWALHNLDGLPAHENGIHEQYAQVAALLVREHGKLAAKQINEETDAEWQTLKAKRQQEVIARGDGAQLSRES